MTRTLAVALAAILALTGCSKSPSGAANPSPCPMVGANGCETVSPGTNTSKVDPHTQAACDEITQIMDTGTDADLTNAPLQTIISDTESSPNIDIRARGKDLKDRRQATTTDHGIAAKLALFTAATELRTTCLRAGWRQS